MKKPKEGRCPKCGGGLDYGTGEVYDRMYSYDVTCLACRWEGKEWYDMTFSGLTDQKTDWTVDEPSDENGKLKEVK